MIFIFRCRAYETDNFYNQLKCRKCSRERNIVSNDLGYDENLYKLAKKYYREGEQKYEDDQRRNIDLYQTYHLKLSDVSKKKMYKIMKMN